MQEDGPAAPPERASAPAEDSEPDLMDATAEGLRDAAREALGVVEFTKGRWKTSVGLLAALDSPWLIGVGILVLGAASGGLWLVSRAAFRDWYMHLGFYAVLVAFGLLYAKAHVRRRRLRAASFGGVFVLLCAFWWFVTSDFLVDRRVWFGGEVVTRPGVHEFRWVAWGLAVAAAGVILHFVGVVAYLRKVRRSLAS